MSTNVNIRTYDNKLYAGMTFKQAEQTGDKKLIKKFKATDKNIDGVISADEIKKSNSTNYKTSLWLGVISAIVTVFAVKDVIKSPNEGKGKFFLDLLNGLWAGTCIGMTWDFFSTSNKIEKRQEENYKYMLQDKEKVLGQKLDKMSE